MKSAKFFCLLFIGFLALHNPVEAQHTSIDAIISDLYESISFDRDTNPDYEAFRSLFIDDGQLISVRDTSSTRIAPRDYEEMMSQQRKSGKIIAFTEKELHRETEKYGGIIHVFSTYQTQLETPEGTNSARGINSIQMIKENKNWRIVSLIWYEENDAHPLPQKYLPATENQ